MSSVAIWQLVQRASHRATARTFPALCKSEMEATIYYNSIHITSLLRSHDEELGESITCFLF